MTTIKPKLNPLPASEEGILYLQIIHNRRSRRISTGLRIRKTEWDPDTQAVASTFLPSRSETIRSVNAALGCEINRLRRIVSNLENSLLSFSVDSIIAEYRAQREEASFFNFMESQVVRLRHNRKHRTSETYRAALNSFRKFRHEEDIVVDLLSPEIIEDYQQWLFEQGLSRNSVSFYMRILRAAYNRVVDAGIIPDRKPFRHVYTGVDKTVKRAIPVKIIKALKELDLSLKPSLDFARDMFIFSFYTRGMSFVDMAYLRNADLQSGILTYRRRKTGQQLTIRWERCMEDIIAKYQENETEYLLPIIKKKGNERRQYDNALHLVNSRLKNLSVMLGLRQPLTMYVARHSWASAAKASNVPLSVISEGMGHDSEATTQIYLASLEASVVDKANRKILGLL